MTKLSKRSSVQEKDGEYQTKLAEYSALYNEVAQRVAWKEQQLQAGFSHFFNKKNICIRTVRMKKIISAFALKELFYNPIPLLKNCAL